MVIKSQSADDSFKEKDYKAILTPGANLILNKNEATIDLNEDIEMILKRAHTKTQQTREKYLLSKSLKMQGCMTDAAEINQLDQKAMDEAQKKSVFLLNTRNLNLLNQEPPRVVVPEHWLAPDRERLFYLKKKKSDGEFYSNKIATISIQGI